MENNKNTPLDSWYKILPETVTFKLLTNQLPTKGRLVYEYNPLRNYRLSNDMYEYNNSLYSLENLYKLYGIDFETKVHTAKIVFEKNLTGKIPETQKDLSEKQDTYTFEISNDENSLYIKSPIKLLSLFKDNNYKLSYYRLYNAIKEAKFENWVNVSKRITDPIYHEAGELVDFISNELKFSLNNPVSIVPQHSYDGSVNLILNDGINIPRLINSRFSYTGKNTYEIIDRKGDNDTNIYDQGEQFDVDTSLYKRTTVIPKLEFNGVFPGGSMPIGNYYFYFKFADADGNETDFIAESGLVSVFIGHSYPAAIHTGISNENSNKIIKFTLTNIDPSYNYVHIYYSRRTAQKDQHSIVEYGKIDKKFIVNNLSICNIIITGLEETIECSSDDINLKYNIASAAETAVSCANMLVMGNIHKPDIPYEELADLSLRFLPYVKEVTYPLDMDENYHIKSIYRGYYDPVNIYYQVGYWNMEFYRFGIVYIMPNNELSPVFNIRGRYNVSEFKATDDKEANQVNKYNDGQYSKFPLFTIDKTTKKKKRYRLSISEETSFIIGDNKDPNVLYENASGVVTFDPNHDTNKIYALDIRCEREVMDELKKYVKGYFFVRQERIPTILCQGITTGLDIASYTPTLPTRGGFIDTIKDSVRTGTMVTTKDLNNVNYISEGFLDRLSLGSSQMLNDILKKTEEEKNKNNSINNSNSQPKATDIYKDTPKDNFSVDDIDTTNVISGGSSIFTESSINNALPIIQKSNLPILPATGIDASKISNIPIELFTNIFNAEAKTSRYISEEYLNRIILKDRGSNKIGAIFCPEFEVNQAFYNQIFTGNSHKLYTTTSQSTNRLSGFESDYFTNKDNHFYIPSYYDSKVLMEYDCELQSVPEDCALVTIGDNKYRSRAGMAEEAWRYESVGQEYKDDKAKTYNSDIIRGIFSAYVAVQGYNGQPCDTVNIMIPGYSKSNIKDYFSIRVDDASSYFPISERYAINDIDEQLIDKSNLLNVKKSNYFRWELYRGDCYLCQFTHRVNRNFNSPSAPFNHVIVGKESWKENYKSDDFEKLNNINLGDVNAVRLGMWVTFRVRSTTNLNVRTIDDSWVDEKIMCGHARGFYPYSPMSTEGSYKISDSYVYNDGFRKSVNERYNFALPDVPYIKNWYGTRIMYSDIHINDAYKNGFRVFRGPSYIDCPRTYGSITKLVELKGSIIVVFEHGIGVITVNPEAVKANVDADDSFIEAYKSLSQPVIISDSIGSQWKDSILKTDGNHGDGICYVYGVDTVSKKIWRTNGTSVDCISNMRVQEFLNNNITLGEREDTPIIGVRNVKTCYNAFKRDVLFTFYDNLTGFEEKVWNLCWNELLQSFITFYSWVPSEMANIDNIPFSFNRNTSKWIAKLGVSHANNSFAYGITLTNNIIENEANKDIEGLTLEDAINKEIINEESNEKESKEEKFIKNRYTVGILGLTESVYNKQVNEEYVIEYSLQRDNFGNYENFRIVPVIKKENDITKTFWELKLITPAINLCSELYYRNKAKNSFYDFDENKIKVDEKSDTVNLATIVAEQYPIFKNRNGQRLNLKREDMIRPERIVTLLNVRADIYKITNAEQGLNERYYTLGNAKQDGESAEGNDSKMKVHMGFYESVVAVIPKWNMQFLSTDFWKHGQAGLIDIADKIFPAYWYGEQHPFEFEFIVADNPSVHKIFTNLQIISNNVKPESFHFEVVGDAYDFARDKKNMYIRQEALKALYQYNKADLLFNRNFTELQPEKQPVSADFPKTYYVRQNTFNDIYDSYIRNTSEHNKNYDHLSGSEIVYYPTRQEFRIATHQRAVSMDEFDYTNDDLDVARAIIASNCKYLEDKWHVVINPIVVTYKKETEWNNNRPPLLIKNSPLPKDINGKTIFSEGTIDNDKNMPEILKNYGYSTDNIDVNNWLDDIDIHGYDWGEASNREETDIRDKFIKIKIRYTGDQLAIIDFITTLYQISFA